jgi:hypothetical protein
MVGAIESIATNGTTAVPVSLGNSAATTTINGSSLTLNETTKIKFTNILDKFELIYGEQMNMDFE